MTDADVHLEAQPRFDTIVTEYPTDARRLRTEYAGMAWIGDRPDAESGMMGSRYERRGVASQLFLPDTHWYDVDALDDVDVQVSVGLFQVPGTDRGTQGLVGAIAEPSVDFFEHPDGLPGAGLCLDLRGEIWSNLGLSYRVVVFGPPNSVLRAGDSYGTAASHNDHGDADFHSGSSDSGGSDSGGGGGGGD
nr:hypothetical protein [Micromonospora sp. DSM 115978]